MSNAELRSEVLHLSAKGYTTNKIAEILKISEAKVIRLMGK